LLGLAIRPRVDSDVISEIQTLNPGQDNRALLVYHPGLSGFHKDVVDEYVRGLVDNVNRGWTVGVVTASTEAPVDWSEYDLVVISSPTYGGQPAPSINRYLSRVNNWSHAKIVVLMTSSGEPTADSVALTLESNGGKVVDSIDLTMMPWTQMQDRLNEAYERAKTLDVAN
jgi:flavorubredoxin